MSSTTEDSGSGAQVEEIIEKDAARAVRAKEHGNQLFAQTSYQLAIDEYTEAISYSPEDDTQNLSIYYANRAACHSMLKQWDQSVEDCSASIELNPNYVKPLLRRASAYEELAKYQEAMDDLNAVIKLDPSNKAAEESIKRVTPLLQAQQEKMKDEMLGKLKELGNGILGKFGLSLDNFKAKKDPTTGSYNISFEQGP